MKLQNCHALCVIVLMLGANAEQAGASSSSWRLVAGSWKAIGNTFKALSKSWGLDHHYMTVHDDAREEQEIAGNDQDNLKEPDDTNHKDDFAQLAPKPHRQTKSKMVRVSLKSNGESEPVLKHAAEAGPYVRHSQARNSSMAQTLSHNADHASSAAAALSSMKSLAHTMAGDLSGLKDRVETMKTSENPNLVEFLQAVNSLADKSNDLGAMLKGIQLHPSLVSATKGQAPRFPFVNELAGDSAETILTRMEDVTNRMDWDLKMLRLKLHKDDSLIENATHTDADSPRAINVDRVIKGADQEEVNGVLYVKRLPIDDVIKGAESRAAELSALLHKLSRDIA